MFQDKRNYHQRLQEFLDCYLETDFRKELEETSKGVSGDPGQDPDELALKFLGLTVLYGTNEDANKITLRRTKDGKTALAVEARGSYQLAPPSPELADRIISIARSITHIEADRGQEPLSLGVQNASIELFLHFDRKGKGGDETLTLVFPKT